MKLNNLINSSEEINMLRELNVCSHKMGQNKNLVQGPGGNTSIKIGRKLFIKASGKRLDNALNENIFIPLCLENVLDSFDNHNKSRQNLELKPLIETDLKPSIETFFHALMPFKVVLHTHPLDIIAITSMDNFRQNFEFILKDIEWDLISYQRPGYPLAESIKESLSNQKSNVLFLANHGLIIGAESIKEAEKIQKYILEKLRISPRKTLATNKNALKEISNKIPHSRLPKIDTIHTLGCDPNSFYLTKKNPLYPDHIVFCGYKPKIIKKDKFYLDEFKNCSYVIVPKLGVILLQEKSELLELMLETQAEIFLRLDINKKINFLTNKDCQELINWEAEKYRKKIN
tara:strand:- start:7 stop:1041 length:1035 start_codon:yes stop_codon:yes gene_type:complete